jgi:hypothetical protein
MKKIFQHISFVIGVSLVQLAMRSWRLQWLMLQWIAYRQERSGVYVLPMDRCACHDPENEDVIPCPFCVMQVTTHLSETPRFRPTELVASDIYLPARIEAAEPFTSFSHLTTLSRN